MRLGKDFGQKLERCLLYARRKKGIFAAVACDAKFGQTEHAGPSLTGSIHSREQVILIVFPIQRRLIDAGSSKAKFGHSPNITYVSAHSNRVATQRTARNLFAPTVRCVATRLLQR